MICGFSILYQKFVFACWKSKLQSYFQEGVKSFLVLESDKIHLSDCFILPHIKYLLLEKLLSNVTGERWPEEYLKGGFMNRQKHQMMTYALLSRLLKSHVLFVCCCHGVRR